MGSVEHKLEKIVQYIYHIFFDITILQDIVFFSPGNLYPPPTKTITKRTLNYLSFTLLSPIVILMSVSRPSFSPLNVRCCYRRVLQYLIQYFYPQLSVNFLPQFYSRELYRLSAK